MKEKIKLIQSQICITLRAITDKSTKSFGLIVPRNIFKRGTEKMFILLKKNISKSICRAILRTKERNSDWLERIM